MALSIQDSMVNNFFGKTTSSEPSPDRATHPFVKTEKAGDHGLGADSIWLRRGVGSGEHTRGNL
jgi:hypothetical protein